MIGLLLIGFMVVFVCSSWIGIRKLASLKTQWQVLVAAPLVCVVLLVPIQAFAGYFLASPILLEGVVSAACAAWFPVGFLLWQVRPTKFRVGLLVPVLFLIPNFFVALSVLSAPLRDASTVRTAEGRISPTASYRVALYPHSSGFAPAIYSYEYEIYKNPRGFPFVWRQVANGTDPCGKGLDAKSLLIGPGPNDHFVQVSCKQPEPGIAPKQIQID